MDGCGACFNEKGELVYDGDWKLGQIHGQGKYIWSKQKYYIGEFQQGQKHGEGIFYIEDVPNRRKSRHDTLKHACYSTGATRGPENGDVDELV